MRLLFLTMLTLTSCGVHISADPIVVKHEIDIAGISEYCRNSCLNAVDPDVCTNTCVLNTIAAIRGN